MTSGEPHSLAEVSPALLVNNLLRSCRLIQRPNSKLAFGEFFFFFCLSVSLWIYPLCLCCVCGRWGSRKLCFVWDWSPEVAVSLRQGHPAPLGTVPVGSSKISFFFFELLFQKSLLSLHRPSVSFGVSLHGSSQDSLDRDTQISPD